MSWVTVGASVALVAREGRLLMVRQRRSYGVFWELPGGYREEGESFEQTAAREVLEETAIEIEVGELLCTLVWEREHDRRRNVTLYFLATPLDAAAEPRPQVEEDIDDAAFLEPREVWDEVHPLEQPVVEGWQNGRELGFYVFATVSVNADGTQSYAFR